MKQSILIKPQHSIIEERPIPTVGEDDVLIRVKACGVCASELHGWVGDEGNYPREYGHEAVGEVVEVGRRVTAFQPGMRVTGLFTKGFAEYACVEQKYVTAIPDRLTYEEALGEPIACVISATRRMRVEYGDTIAVIGLGFMGLFTLQALRLRGAKTIIAIDPRTETHENARRFGADAVYTPDQVPAKLMLVEWDHIGKGWGVDLAVEASGTQAGLALAGKMVQAHGMLAIVGYHQGGPRQVDVQMWNWKGIDVLNAHERRMDFLMDCMRRGLAMIEAGKLDTASMITHRFPLSEVDQAFRALHEKHQGICKVIVQM